MPNSSRRFGREAVGALSLEFLILTDVRTDAVLKAKWQEFDLDKALWTVPLVNLKDREHRTEAFEVPLSPRAIEILRAAQKDQDERLRLPWPEEGHRSQIWRS